MKTNIIVTYNLEFDSETLNKGYSATLTVKSAQCPDKVFSEESKNLFIEKSVQLGTAVLNQNK